MRVSQHFQLSLSLPLTLPHPLLRTALRASDRDSATLSCRWIPFKIVSHPLPKLPFSLASHREHTLHIEHVTMNSAPNESTEFPLTGEAFLAMGVEGEERGLFGRK